MRIENIPIDQINPAAYNPRVDLKPGDPAYEKLKRSIHEFGYIEPVVWNKRTGNLVGGHQRLKVLVAEGATEVQAVVVNLSLEREKALNIALNKISGDWDENKLATLLAELVEVPDLDIELTGFDLPDVKDMLADLLSKNGETETFDVEAELKANRPIVTQPGELFELGQHRLLCGDSTKVEDVRRLMDGQRAILFATDPPYLVNYDGMNHPGSRKERRCNKSKNKNWSDSYGITWDEADANPELYEKFIGMAVAEAIAPNAAWYCFHASRRQAMVDAAWQKHGAFVHQQIIWAKDRPILTRSWYTWKHEPCFFGWMRPHKPPRRSKDFLPSVWQIPTVPVGQPTEHPTSKPLEVFAIPMRQHTRAGEICYEPFCGSGSQLIAAEQLGRRCFAMEISPRYCDVIIRRHIALVGEQAVAPAIADKYRLPAMEEVRA